MEVNTAHLESTYITGEGYNKHLNSLIEMSNAKPPSDDIQAAQTFSLGNLVLFWFPTRRKIMIIGFHFSLDDVNAITMK